jgi:hypothetical protein
MTYVPLVAILVVLFGGAAATLTILFRAHQKGLFDNLRSGAYVIFDDDEPVGEPQDHVFYPEESRADETPS